MNLLIAAVLHSALCLLYLWAFVKHLMGSCLRARAPTTIWFLSLGCCLCRGAAESWPSWLLCIQCNVETVSSGCPQVTESTRDLKYLDARADKPETRQPVFRWLMKVKLCSGAARARCWERKQRSGCVYIFPCDRLVKIPLQTSPCGPLICLERWGHDVKCSMTHSCIVFSFNEDALCCTVHCPTGRGHSLTWNTTWKWASAHASTW